MQVTEKLSTTSEETVDGYGWALRLINAWNPLSAGYVPELALIGTHNGENREFDARAAGYVSQILLAARNDGVNLRLTSAYRSIVRQEENFIGWYNRLINQGYSPERAFELTAMEIAVPGTSEHNAGLAIDFNYTIDTEHLFDQTAEFLWLNTHAYKYGFILRYPEGKAHITGINYEPWHWRFVGVENAARIYKSGLTLEEFIGECRGDDSVFESFRQQIISR
jgi:D-alanyl-D-alanine carboxypeptidase